MAGLLLNILFEIIAGSQEVITIVQSPCTLPPTFPMVTSNMMVVRYQDQETDVATVLLTRLLTLFSFMLFKYLPICHSISLQSSGLHSPYL